MSSETYWKEREAKNLAQNQLEEEEYSRRLKEIYQNQLDAIQKEIDSFYGKYADSEGITIAEAKKRVAKLDIEAYERKAARYVAEKNFSEKANREMRLYNATMKINRLELLKANIGLELIAGHEELDRFMEEILQGRTEDELKRQAGILGKTVQQNAKMASSIVNASFHNATFSDRIWMYQDLLKNELASTLQSGLIQGKNPRDLARTIQRRFDVQTSNAERLMRTELARVQTDAQKRSLEENGFEEYEFIANGHCCPVCDALDGKHFNLRDLMPGKNAPPMHPNCRCSTAAYEDDEEYRAWLDYLAKGGTTEEWEKVRSNIGYEQEKSSKKDKEYSVIWENVNSKEYRDKFKEIYEDEKVQKTLHVKAIDILRHRQGTDYEDMHLINRFTGKTEASQTKVEYEKNIPDELKHNQIWYNSEIKRAISKTHEKTFITVHNHPDNKPPSGGDFEGAFRNGYYAGISVCHNGTIYYYKVGKKRFTGTLYDATVDKYKKLGYNEDKAYELTLNQFQEQYGIVWRKI